MTYSEACAEARKEAMECGKEVYVHPSPNGGWEATRLPYDIYVRITPVEWEPQEGDAEVQAADDGWRAAAAALPPYREDGDDGQNDDLDGAASSNEGGWFYPD